MESKFCKTTLTGAILTLACLTTFGSANATVITHGSLTTDDTTNFISDTVTGRMYTRFNAFNLSASDTLAVTGNGGAFEGWSIATELEADDFIAAALGLSTTACTGLNTAWDTNCGTIAGWSDGGFGATYNSNVDHFAFIGDTNIGDFTEVGLVAFRSSGAIDQYEEWNSIPGLDAYSGAGGAINYLLYQDVVVNEPSTLSLLGLGLAGLGFARRRKKS